MKNMTLKCVMALSIVAVLLSAPLAVMMSDDASAEADGSDINASFKIDLTKDQDLNAKIIEETLNDLLGTSGEPMDEDIGVVISDMFASFACGDLSDDSEDILTVSPATIGGGYINFGISSEGGKVLLVLDMVMNVDLDATINKDCTGLFSMDFTQAGGSPLDFEVSDESAFKMISDLKFEKDEKLRLSTMIACDMIVELAQEVKIISNNGTDFPYLSEMAVSVAGGISLSILCDSDKGNDFEMNMNVDFGLDITDSFTPIGTVFDENQLHGTEKLQVGAVFQADFAVKSADVTKESTVTIPKLSSLLDIISKESETDVELTTEPVDPIIPVDSKDIQLLKDSYATLGVEANYSDTKDSVNDIKNDIENKDNPDNSTNSMIYILVGVLIVVIVLVLVYVLVIKKKKV